MKLDFTKWLWLMDAVEKVLQKVLGLQQRVMCATDEDNADPVQAQNKQYRSELASHQAQLEALKQQDPEFYAYLQQTDQELLNFGQDDDEEEEEPNTDNDSQDEVLV